MHQYFFVCVNFSYCFLPTSAPRKQKHKARQNQNQNAAPDTIPVHKYSPFKKIKNAFLKAVVAMNLFNQPVGCARFTGDEQVLQNVRIFLEAGTFCLFSAEVV
jgi:hypothetical protein